MPTDPALALPSALSRIAPLSGPGDTLVYAGAARARPFVLATPGCTLRGTEMRGVEAVELGGRLLLGGVTVAGATCGNVLLAPAQARRELIRSVTLIETLLVSGSGLIAQWASQGASSAEIDLLLVVPGEAARAEGPFLRVDGADGVRLVQITPAPAWRVVERPDGSGLVHAFARMNVDQGGSRLAATMGADLAAAEAALARLGHVRERRAEADLVELRERRLATRTGADIDEALAWASARIEAALGGGMVHDLAAGEPFPFDPDARRAWTALGALASGRPERTEVDAGTPLGALARARTATLRGQRTGASDLPTLADAAGDATPDAALRVARRAALLEAADALEPWVGREAAGALRARAAALAGAPGAPGAPSAPAQARAALRLPTLGGGAAAEHPVAAALAAALDLPDRLPYQPPATDPPPGLLRALTAWACLNDGALERGFALFRGHLADGFTGGAGLWPDGGRVHDPAAAAMVPLVLAHGLLGVRVDAHYGRLRLSPRLPSHWNRLAVRGIAIGEARVRMDYESGAGEHRFRFVQESGAVPVMLVFEPLLAVGADARARVDGEPATLDVRAPHPRSGGRAQIKVQLPLDRERELSVG